MTYYSPQDIERISRARSRVAATQQRLISTLIQRAYRTPRSREFALHGFGRRFATLRECIDLLFEALPPEISTVPSDKDRAMATIAFQSFLINVFGCLDNLAWLWVEEKNVRRANGQQLPPSKVGMSEAYPIVRASFPAAFRDYLERRQGWFNAMEGFRHALAHRIPPYIPPCSVLPENLAEYQKLDAAIADATLAKSFEQVEGLRTQQRRLEFFRPCITHSYEEEAPFVVIHFQMLTDFGTIEEMACQLLGAMDA